MKKCYRRGYLDHRKSSTRCYVDLTEHFSSRMLDCEWKETKKQSINRSINQNTYYYIHTYIHTYIQSRHLITSLILFIEAAMLLLSLFVTTQHTSSHNRSEHSYVPAHSYTIHTYIRTYIHTGSNVRNLNIISAAYYHYYHHCCSIYANCFLLEQLHSIKYTQYLSSFATEESWSSLCMFLEDWKSSILSRLRWTVDC